MKCLGVFITFHIHLAFIQELNIDKYELTVEFTVFQKRVSNRAKHDGQNLDFILVYTHNVFRRVTIRQFHKI